MNNCSQAPQTSVTKAAAEQYLDSWNRTGMDWDAWMVEVGLAKAAFARLIGALPEEIAVTSSVSEATSAVASALDFAGPRNRIVVTEAEFPTVGQVWLAQERRGAKVSWVPVTDGRIDPPAYEPLVSDRTAIVSACHGYFLNGFTQDLRALADLVHAHGALLYTDAYQTAGAMPIDVKAMGVDFLASGNLKFLMGIPGIAFLYVRPEVVEQLRPTVTGWMGRVYPFTFDPKRLDWAPGARRFDTGTPPVLNAYIARAGMEMIAELGIQRIRAWHEVLIQRLIDGGRARGLQLHGVHDPGRKTVSTAFVIENAHGVEAAMRARGVLPAARGPVVRLAPHFYSSLDDVDTALDLLAEVARGG
ncbi:MAG TPA: aminotransferase class V-fold PLP-dependent enzyme [Gemmatimonadales bacterium]|nr:aminotransferase class V-fold PLP-dependent enzyme [Gemmatimonadales bacterium]